MATKRKSRKRGGRRRNASARKATTAIAKRNPNTVARSARSASPRKNPARRSSRRSSRLRNPLGGSVLGLRPMDLVGGAAGLIIDGALQLVVPAGWLGIGIRAGGAIAMVKFLPKSLGPAAGLTAGAITVRDAINKVVNVSSLVNQQVVKLLPAQPLPVADPTGMGGFVNISANSPLFRNDYA